ncbi:hypothetical protein ACFYZ8_35175 [Streptomyces sp. NPDC001668]|uniref:hypothetical protein n=1 Tax=unclassified Streptomyces TaxID=2593676 RepID=UPI003686CAA3
MPKITAPQGTRTFPASPLQRKAVEEWVASAHPSPGMVWDEWSSVAKLALIPLGHNFEAIRVPESLVHVAAMSEEPPTVGVQLAQHLRGPVIHDPGFRRYYALVPVGTATEWTAPDAECLSSGTYLGVPRADHTEMDEHTRASYWSVPMTRPGHLCSAEAVLALVIVGRSPDVEYEE